MKYHLQESIFDIIDTEEKAYWLGFIWSDGSVYINLEGKRNDHRLIIRLNKKDVDHLKKFKSFLQTDKPLLSYKDNSMAIVIDNKRITLALRELGIHKRKSFQDEFLYLEKIPSHLINHFWRGVVDGDGWVKHTPKSEVGVIGNIGTILAFKDYCKNKLQFDSKVQIVQRTHISVSYQITALKARQLLNHLYKGSTIYLDRKFERAAQMYDIITDQRNKYKHVPGSRAKRISMVFI